MRRMRAAAAMGVLIAALAGCALQPSGVEEGPSAPTGVAPGATLYFLDDGGDLTAVTRDTQRLGTVAQAVALMLTGPGESGLATGIPDTTVTRTEVTISGDVMSVRVPIAARNTSAAGVDQIVCTAFASHVQAGGADDTRVSVSFTDRTTEPRTCPIGH